MNGECTLIYSPSPHLPSFPVSSLILSILFSILILPLPHPPLPTSACLPSLSGSLLPLYISLSLHHSASSLISVLSLYPSLPLVSTLLSVLSKLLGQFISLSSRWGRLSRITSWQTCSALSSLFLSFLLSHSSVSLASFPPIVLQQTLFSSILYSLFHFLCFTLWKGCFPIRTEGFHSVSSKREVWKI